MSSKTPASDPLATLPASLDFLRPAPSTWQQSAAEAFLARLDEQAALERQRHFRPRVYSWAELPLDTPATDALIADLRDLLRGSAGLRRKDQRKLPVRRLLQLLDAHALEAQRSAREAVERLATQSGVLYAHDYISDWTPQTFEQVTAHHIASPAYLDWAIQASALPRSSQARLGTLLTKDAGLQWESNHGISLLSYGYAYDSDLDKNIKKHKKELEEDEDKYQRSVDASTEDVQRLLAARPFDVNMRPRPMLDSEGIPWTVYAPWAANGYKYDTPSWPFVRAQARATGDLPSPPLLAREASARRALGQLINFPQDRWCESSESSGDAPSHDEIQALKDWIALADTGLVLRVAGAALQQLAEVETSDQRCRVCWRHLSSGGRLYCTLHRARPTVRSDADRLAAWAERRAVQWSATLSMLLQRDEPLQEVVDRVTKAWQAIAVMNALPESKTPTSEQIDRQLDSLRNLLADLHPFTEGAVATRLDKALATAAERARKDKPSALNPIVFFGDYFAVKNPEDDMQPDTAHPIGPLHRDPSKDDADKHRWKVLPDFRDYLARDLIRDLLAQRVWLEMGGNKMEAKARELRNVKGTKGHIPKPVHRSSKIDEEQAKKMRSKGWTNAKIARHFGVSPAAVSQFFQKRG